ncbi:hypothetical protein INR49_026259 [Caranx melampygus]|nr:hypothetical protein INR49_026259 [Caranx melampygus]
MEGIEKKKKTSTMTLLSVMNVDIKLYFQPLTVVICTRIAVFQTPAAQHLPLRSSMWADRSIQFPHRPAISLAPHHTNRTSSPALGRSILRQWEAGVIILAT